MCRAIPLFLAVPILALLAWSTSAQEKKGDNARDLEKFQGKWVAVAKTTDGKVFNPNEIEEIRLVFKDRQVTEKVGSIGPGVTYYMRIDSGKEPAQIDIWPPLMDAKTIKGIYKFEGDTLTICVGEVGKDRPTEFVSKAGSGTNLLVVKRAK
jgi:uncharacterized protein (TIGR03067 family)